MWLFFFSLNYLTMFEVCCFCDEILVTNCTGVAKPVVREYGECGEWLGSVVRRQFWGSRGGSSREVIAKRYA